MKNKITFVIILLLNALAFAQKATKTRFMVLPSDNWMTQNKYYKTIDNQGTTENIFNYKQAILENTDLLPVIAKIEGILTERGLFLKNFEAALNTVTNDNAENAVLSSKTTKSSVSESPFDLLMKTAKADVLVKVTWNVIKTGPKSQIQLTLQGVDAYTNEPFASSPAIGKASFESSVPILLEESVLTIVDDFLAKVDAHAQDTFDNGRKVKIIVKKWDSWSGDLESEYAGKELNEILEDWIRANAVNNVFEVEESTENKIVFGVRIPVLNESGSGMSANDFTRPLSKLLKAPPYSIQNKIMNYGLGKSQIILGEK